MYQEKYTKEEVPPISEFKYLEMGYVYKPANEEEYTGFSRNIFGDMSIVQPTREKQNNVGLYRTTFFYNTKDPYESYLYGDFYMDFDSETDVRMAKEDLLYTIWFFHLRMGFSLPMESFHIFFSGKKGFHLIIPAAYFGYSPSKTLDEDFKWIGSEVNHRAPYKTIDLAVYERRRLLRLENSIHPETGLHKIPLHYDELVNLSIEEIYELAKEPRLINYPIPELSPETKKEWDYYMEDFANFKKEQKNKHSGGPSIPKGEMPEPVKELIERGPVKGLRNETVAALTSYFKNQEYSKEDIFIELENWNQGSIPKRELETTINSILKRDLNYSLGRFKSLVEGQINSYEEGFKEYKENKRKGYV